MHPAAITSPFACSGPGAGEAIRASIAYGDRLALVSAVVLAASALLWARWRRSPGWAAACGLLLLLHPAWTVIARIGDCGLSKRVAATMATGLAGACLAAQWQARRRQEDDAAGCRRPPV